MIGDYMQLYINIYKIIYMQLYVYGFFKVYIKYNKENNHDRAC